MVLREEDALAFIPLWLLLLKGVMRASSADIGQFSGAGRENYDNYSQLQCAACCVQFPGLFSMGLTSA